MQKNAKKKIKIIPSKDPFSIKDEFKSTFAKTVPQYIYLSPPKISGIINSPEAETKTKKKPV